MPLSKRMFGNNSSAKVWGFILAAPFLGLNLVAAQPADEPQELYRAEDEVTVIETEVGLDQFVGPGQERAFDQPQAQVDVRFVGQEREAVTTPQPERAGFVNDLSQEQAGSPQSGPAETVQIQDTLLMRLNAALRRAIEQNQQLKDDNQQLDRDVKNYMGQKRIDVNRINSIMLERDAYKKQTERILGIKEKLEDNISRYKEAYREKEQKYEDKISSLQRQLKIKEQQPVSAEALAQTVKPDATAETSMDVRKKSLAVIDMADSLTEQKNRLKREKGKIHYNMGNVFFHQGLYERALAEYRQAVSLMPDDPSAHFNLAFISSDFVLDQKRALIHYKHYLRLNPGASDAELVKEKILEAELDLQSRTQSSLENDLNKYRERIYTYQSSGP